MCYSGIHVPVFERLDTGYDVRRQMAFSELLPLAKSNAEMQNSYGTTKINLNVLSLSALKVTGGGSKQKLESYFCWH